MARLGLHWPDATRQYADGTPFVERMVVRQGVPQEEYHPDKCHDRVALLAANHPISEILVRIDYREGQAIPHDVTERAEYLSRLAWAINRPAYHGLGGSVIFQMGNEPQLEGAPPVELLAEVFNGKGGNFAGTVQSWAPDARTAFIPIAPYHPDRLGMANGVSREGSPWADVYHEALDTVMTNGLQPDVLSVHAYGDPMASDTPHREPWEEAGALDSNGWRWRFNVLRTWAEVHKDNGASQPVWLTEVNTAAHWNAETREGAPAQSYPVKPTAEWLIHMMGAASAIMPNLDAVCWFVGEGRGVWDDFALHGGQGNMPVAEDHFEWCQSHGY